VGTINYHESIVAKGLGQTDLDSYLLSIRSLKDALHQLESSKYKSSEKITQDLVGTYLTLAWAIVKGNSRIGRSFRSTSKFVWRSSIGVGY
jgi:hypothetical protein